jgi:hypothetical protein
VNVYAPLAGSQNAEETIEDVTAIRGSSYLQNVRAVLINIELLYGPNYFDKDGVRHTQGNLHGNHAVAFYRDTTNTYAESSTYLGDQFIRAQQDRNMNNEKGDIRDYGIFETERAPFRFI